MNEAIMSELLGDDDDFLTSTAAATVIAHRGRKVYACQRGCKCVKCYYPRTVGGQPELAPAPIAEAPETTPLVRHAEMPEWGNVTKVHAKMTAAQLRALRIAAGPGANGYLERGRMSSITTLRALIRNGWATAIEGYDVDGTGRTYRTLVAVTLTPAGRNAAARS